MSTQTDGVATDLERVDLAQWKADESRWRGQRPVVIAGAFADTVAVTTWTPESLAELFPDMKVKATYTYMTLEGWRDVSRVKFESMTMPRFVSLLREGQPGLLAKWALGDMAGRYKELDIPRAATPPYFAVNMWMGNRTLTELHSDRDENMFIQVYGTKRFILEPPTSPARRYMRDGSQAHFSRVDPLAPDPVLFPEYHPGHQKIAPLSAGDALYIPADWFHHVTAFDTSISVNCWYDEG